MNNSLAVLPQGDLLKLVEDLPFVRQMYYAGRMKTYTKRELNQQTATVLAAVTADEPVVITENGVARWRIEAVSVHPDPIERLIAQGRIALARDNPPELTARTRLGTGYTEEQIDAIYEEMRGEW